MQGAKGARTSRFESFAPDAIDSTIAVGQFELPLDRRQPRLPGSRWRLARRPQRAGHRTVARR